jgi:hypothetical protein
VKTLRTSFRIRKTPSEADYKLEGRRRQIKVSHAEQSVGNREKGPGLDYGDNPGIAKYEPHL